MAFAGSSLSFASTPLATTTTTTNTTLTGSLTTHDSREQQQQQPVSSLKNRSETQTTMSSSESSATGISGSVCPDEAELPEDIASYFEHWASPTEVLQLQAMCTDLFNKHKNEIFSLRRELDEVTRGRDALLLELRETQRLRKLYEKAEEEYEKVRREREQWSEEREMLRLQLQRLSVENQRLKHILSKKGRFINVQPHCEWVAPVSSSSGGGGGATIPTPTTASVIPTPSSSSGLAGHAFTEGSCGNQHPVNHQFQRQPQQQNRQLSEFDAGCSADNNNISTTYNDNFCYTNNAIGDALNMALLEQLRLSEELYRCSMEYAELEVRFEFNQTLWNMTAARAEQRSMLLVVESENLKQKVRYWQNIAEENAGRLEAVSTQLGDRCGELEEARRALLAEREKAQVAVDAEHSAAQDSIALIKAAHAEELVCVKQQLQFALDDAVRTREKLQAAMDSAQRFAEARREELLADVEAAEQKCSNALQARSEMAAALAEATAAHKQQCALLERELELLRGDRETSLREKAGFLEELREARDEMAALEARLRDAEEELQATRGRLVAALGEVQMAKDAEGALLAARERVEEAEAQQVYYEEQLRVHQSAVMALQRHHDEEMRRLTDALERVRRRYASSKVRLAAAVRGIGRANVPAAPQTAESGGGAEVNDATEQLQTKGKILFAVQKPEGPDALLLLQQSATIAATLARTIHRGETFTA